MGLYLAIVLLALLVGFGGDGSDWIDEVTLIWGTTIGLLVAHLFAYWLSAIMVEGSRPEAEDYWAALGIIGAAAAVGLLATVPYWIWRDSLDASTASSVLLMATIAVAGYWTARHAGAQRPRAALYTAIVLVGAAVAVMVKYTLTH